ncbi:MAG: hypothetical protein JXX28_12260 [Deltaproteobacteria bacterium]|nr:hypothetical protein [Deltaproteobacteria bacterium]
MLPLALALGLLTTPSFADEPACELSALKTELEEASPIAVPEVYVRLASCDPKEGLKLAGPSLHRTLPGDAGNAAAEAAIHVGAGDAVLKWISAQEADERSRTIANLGGKCAADEDVAAFLVRAHGILGEDFWKDRWYRGMADCRTREIQDLLSRSIDGEEAGAASKDRHRFHSVLEVYARNLGANAIPKLNSFATTYTDREDLLPILSAYGDAANLGAVDGPNPKVVELSIGAIEHLGPDLPAFAIPQARDILRALGAEQLADNFSMYRWPDRFHDSGYSYAAVVVEDYTCGNGKKYAIFHHAYFKEGGHLWPDQVAEMLPEKVLFEWQLSPGSTCKGGVGTLKVDMPEEPFADVESARAWVEARRKTFQEQTVTGYHKLHEVEHDLFEM